ncbi:unnamed protein product [Prorocentrum cordatum]|uniref:Uncharacterized protein n=1 Tax=Prorocentrum cordatum TaxID=2364126 RepID=A0ABN9RS35_9DINO|nr:unnamed protein product [Polarella glacialis]
MRLDVGPDVPHADICVRKGDRDRWQLLLVLNLRGGDVLWTTARSAGVSRLTTCCGLGSATASWLAGDVEASGARRRRSLQAVVALRARLRRGWRRSAAAGARTR